LGFAFYVIKVATLKRRVPYSAGKRRWYREPLVVFGSALFGAFIPGFITELSTGHQILTVVYTAMGFSGMLLLFLGLRR